MRQVYKYRLVRYYPYLRSDEFFNVGVWVVGENENRQLYIDSQEEHIKHLFKFLSLDKKIFMFFLESLKKETDINSWYGEYLRFSEIDVVASSSSIDEVTKNLYRDYIGYKFKEQDKKDRFREINEKTREIYEKKYNKFFQMSSDNQYSFKILYKDKQFFNRFGSIGDKNDIMETIYFSLNDKKYTTMKMYFLDIIKNSQKDIKNKVENFLKPNHIDYVSYITDDNIEEHFETNIIQSA